MCKNGHQIFKAILTFENDKAKRWRGWGTEGKDRHPWRVLFSLPNYKESQSEALLACPEAIPCKVSHSPAFFPVKPLCKASSEDENTNVLSQSV